MTAPYDSPVADWFQEHVVDRGRLPLFACFAVYIVTFLGTRTVTRLIRSGRGPFTDNVSASGLHVHHAVPGIVLLVTGAFMAVSIANDSGWMVVAGILVGVGTSLVLDEFALILHLQDVYWAEEGRCLGRGGQPRLLLPRPRGGRAATHWASTTTTASTRSA